MVGTPVGSSGGGAGTDQPVYVQSDYYIAAFARFHEELERSGYRPQMPHPHRAAFWRDVETGLYSPHDGAMLLDKYLVSIERQLRSTIGEHSLAYWLHVYRRLFPGPIGHDQGAMTVGLTRAAMEAAIQKYSHFQPCSAVGFSGGMSIDQVLRGLLTGPEFQEERKAVEQRRQLVLTDFGACELRLFYDAEKLAYELWRSTAQLRALGKGASLAVHGPPEYVSDCRGTELTRLIEVYDRRVRNAGLMSCTAKGVVFDSLGQYSQGSGVVFLPTYNVGGVTTTDLAHPFQEIFNARILNEMKPNFVWLPFDLRAYREAHLPLAGAFAETHGLSLDAVLLLVATLCQRVFIMWNEGSPAGFFRFWQRAYEGPYKRDYVADELQNLSSLGAACLALVPTQVDNRELLAAAGLLELDEERQDNIDVRYPGPHHLLLPYGEDRLFIDYAWIIRRLYDLFLGVSIADENFKGAALEQLVRVGGSALPAKPCKAENGQAKQIDAAFRCGEHLVIAECRAVGKSIGFDRGDPKAIEYRTERINKALSDIDEKARWLAKHPRGTNYDVRGSRSILPLVVTPFVEFMPSLDPFYWTGEDSPRVVNPQELVQGLQDGTLARATLNCVPVT